jgi:carboxypeptidase D
MGNSLNGFQNTTFGGIQGFTVPPNTPWYDDRGAFAGTIRQERNWTLAIIYGAGHQTPVYNAHRTFAFMRDFVLGNSSVGLVETNADGTVYIHTATQPKGAVIPTMLPDGVIPGQDEIMTDNNKHATTWPVATRVAWSSHLSLVMATAMATPTTFPSYAITTASMAPTLA